MLLSAFILLTAIPDLPLIECDWSVFVDGLQSCELLVVVDRWLEVRKLSRERRELVLIGLTHRK